ncbi:unnamed protein product [Nyctereutes procyonoides]|uniref:(raccoon dog) hypothetical protein n=1 Tax=Nyctereutes procyonoides TaxID=34880 RepID=A0A811ZWB0_NYCPR|nr:unnamed protein product [Nyctereutes procyonoides]
MFFLQWHHESDFQIAAVIIATEIAAIRHLAFRRFYAKDHWDEFMVNLHIQKDKPKTVYAFDIKDLGDKALPFCHGSHTKHNEETGDNVGPLLIKKKGNLSVQFSRCKPTCHGVT